MSFADNNGAPSVADIAAVMRNNNGNGSIWGGDGAWWLMILFLFALNGGWSNGFGNGSMMYPMLMGQNTNNDVQRGFDQSAVMNGLSGISGLLYNGFANAEVSRCNSQTNILQAMNNNQTVITNILNSLAMALQNCCCENRAATADLKYTVATEACADRAAVKDALQNVLTAQSAGFQSLHDKLCQLELDGFKQKYADALAEINALKFDRSQTAQDAFFQNALNNAVNRLNPAPIPAYTVQNPNCCATSFNNGFGCTAA